jgi:hypothetical protein
VTAGRKRESIGIGGGGGQGDFLFVVPPIVQLDGNITISYSDLTLVNSTARAKIRARVRNVSRAHLVLFAGAIKV